MKQLYTLLFALISLNAIAQTSVVTATGIGSSGNAFTCAYGTKAYLWADPFLGIIIFSHRGGPIVGDPTTRYVRFDMSSDGGITWNNNLGPIFSDVTNNEKVCYPQCALYNPIGNTNTDSAYLAYYAPFVDSATSIWAGFAYGASNLNAPLAPTQTTELYGPSHQATVVEEMFISRQNVVWVPAAKADNNMIYYDSIYIDKGTWNSSQHDFTYTRTAVSCPVVPTSGPYSGYAYADCRVSFAPNGLTGYLVVAGHHVSQGSSPNIYPIVYKTIDGGQTWSSPTHVSLSATGTALGYNASLYTIGSQIDLIVDSLGNPHIMTTAGAGDGNWQLDTTYGHWGVFDITSPDGGVTWTMTLLDKPHRLRCYFNIDLVDDIRPQISTNYNGSKIFYSWFATDTTLHPSATTNSNPDAWLLGLNITTGLWTLVENISDTVTGASGHVRLANTSYYCATNGSGEYYVPITFADFVLPINMFQPVQHKYLGNFMVNDSSFSNQRTTLITGISEPLFRPQQRISVYPNPANDEINYSFVLTEGSSAVFTITDNTGRICLQKNLVGLNSGLNTGTINIGGLSSGLYTISISTPDNVSNEMFVVSRME